MLIFKFALDKFNKYIDNINCVYTWLLWIFKCIFKCVSLEAWHREGWLWRFNRFSNIIQDSEEL